MPPENFENNTEQGASTPNPELKQIRTFQGDVANALSDQKESIFSIHHREAAKKREAGAPEEGDEGQKKKDLVFLLVGGVVLILLGSLGAWYGYREIVERNTPPVLAIPENRFIAATSETEIYLGGQTREGFASAFLEAASGNPEDSLRHIVGKVGAGETERIITTEEFFSLIESRAPGNLVRAFEPLFMMGVLGESRFMILKLSSFENAFAGMLAWEETMAEDLIPLFSNVEALKAIAPGAVFNDVIVRNKDVRVLSIDVIPAQEDPAATSTVETGSVESRPALLYSFFDNSVLIITDRIETLQTLIERLARARLSR